MVACRLLRLFFRWLLMCGLVLSCGEKQPNVLTEQYQYDPQGRLTVKVNPDGSKLIFHYNKECLPVSLKFSGGEVKYGYNGSHKITWVRDASGGTEYFYDALGRVTGVLWHHGVQRLVLYAYDPWGRVTYTGVMSLPTLRQAVPFQKLLQKLEQKGTEKGAGRPDREAAFTKLRAGLLKADHGGKPWVDHEIICVYDLLGNLTRIGTPAGPVLYRHDPGKGRAERLLPNGVRSLYTFSPDGVLKSLRHENGNGHLIVEYRHEYYPTGKISKITEIGPGGAKSTDFSWDSRGYLQELRLPDGILAKYAYDAMGNRIQKESASGATAYAYDGFGRLVMAGNLGHKWNLNGNMIFQMEGQAKTWIKYDGRSLPVSVRTKDTKVAYGWDGGGHLIFRKAGDETTHYLPQPLAPPGLPLAEYNAKGNLTAAYVYGDGLLGKRDNQGRMRFFLEDGLNSIRHLVDQQGNVVGQQSFTPFGEPLGPHGALATDFRATGERFFPELKAYLIGNRFYRPDEGRFLTPGTPPGDRGRPDSFNRYAHASSLPEVYVEPRATQTRKTQVNVLVGGVSARNPRLTEEVHRYGFDVGIPVNRGPMCFGLPVLDGLQATWDQVTGGAFSQTAPYLFKSLVEIGNIEVLGVHSPGAITLGNLHRQLDAALSQGKLHLKKIVFLGAQPNENLVAILNKHKIPFETKTANALAGCNPYQGLYHDPVVTLTTPNLSLRRNLAPLADPPNQWGIAGMFKVAALLSALPVIPGHFPFEAHSLDRLLGKTARTQGSPPLGIMHVLSQVNEQLTPFLYLKKEQQPSQGPDVPPAAGKGHPGPGRLAALAGRLEDPFKGVQARLAGVRLAGGARFSGGLGRIVGAVYDREKEYVVLLGERGKTTPPIKPEDLAIALVLVSGRQDPHFTLDPADPRNPKGPWLRAIYIPRPILESTEFGKALFEADWLLKQYAFGVTVDAAGRVRDRVSRVPGFQSQADLMFASRGHANRAPTWARMWIVSEEMQLKESGDAISFERVKMRVKAKKQVPDPSSRSGLRDVEVEDDPISSRFAQLFSELYDQIAQESPEFERVKQLAQVVALAKWLNKERIPLDMQWVKEQANKRVETVARINTLDVQKQQSTHTHIQTVMLFGGVDLTVRPIYVRDDGKAQALQDAVREKVRQALTGPVFTVNLAGKNLQGVVLPVTKKGQQLWKDIPAIQVEGVTYQFDRSGQITKSIDGHGDTSQYAYDVMGNVKQLTVIPLQGGRITGEKTPNGSTWQVKAPDGRSAHWSYGSNGLIKELELDGHKWAALEVSSEGRFITAEYEGFSERQGFDADGRLSQYQGGPGKTVDGPGVNRLVVHYDRFGNVQTIATPAVTLCDLAYTPDGKRFARVSQGGEDIKYAYGPMGRLKEVSSSRDATAEFTYSGNDVVRLQINSRGAGADYTLGPEGLKHSQDPQGEVTDFTYDHGRLVGVHSKQHGETLYRYDDQQRLQEIHFPNGSKRQLKYSSRGASKKKPEESQEELVAMVSVPGQPPARPPTPPLPPRTPGQSSPLEPPSREVPNLVPAPVKPMPTPEVAPPKPRGSSPLTPTAQEIAPIYKKIMTAADPDTVAQGLVGQKLGNCQVTQWAKSFTTLRAFQIKGPAGISVLKVRPQSRENEKRVTAAAKMIKHFRRAGLPVVDILPVAGGKEMDVAQGVIVTRESLAPGEPMADRQVSPEEFRQYLKIEFALFRQGNIPAADDLKPPVRAQETMRKRLEERITLSKRMFFDMFLKSPEQLKRAHAIGADAARTFHAQFIKVVGDLFTSGAFRETGYVHDNNPRNIFIDANGKFTVIDFEGDYIGNLGNVFSGAMETFGALQAKHGKTWTEQEFSQEVDRLFEVYGQEAGQLLTPAERYEVLCCMVMTPYEHSSADSRMLIVDLKRRLGIPVGEEGEKFFQQALQDPKNRVQLGEAFQANESIYVRRLQQLVFTLEIVKEKTADPKKKLNLENLLERLKKILEQRLRIVRLEPGGDSVAGNNPAA
jgi:YD repeat-containing protein